MSFPPVARTQVYTHQLHDNRLIITLLHDWPCHIHRQTLTPTGVESLHGTFGREHKYGKQHHLAHGAPPPPGPEITTVGEHLVGEAATLGLQPGQELRYM